MTGREASDIAAILRELGFPVGIRRVGEDRDAREQCELILPIGRDGRHYADLRGVTDGDPHVALDVVPLVETSALRIAAVQGKRA
jgi:hypothetical protein